MQFIYGVELFAGNNSRKVNQYKKCPENINVSKNTPKGPQII